MGALFPHKNLAIQVLCTVPSLQMLSVIQKCFAVPNECYRSLLLWTAVCGISADSVPSIKGSTSHESNRHSWAYLDQEVKTKQSTTDLPKNPDL